MSEKFVTKGYFTVKKSEKFWSGVWTDLTIEQDCIRLLKTKGGLIRGGGITESTLASWIHALPPCAPLCEAIENYSRVKSSTCRATRESRRDAHRFNYCR